jgi:hypothetical protein
MQPRTLSLPVLIAALVCWTVSAVERPPRSIAPATVFMQLPDASGEMERPVVEFNHAAHTEALEAEGCKACHRIDDEGVLIPRLTSVLDLDDRDALIDAYHDSCMGCHSRRSDLGQATGPVTCGECHVRRRPGTSTRAAMAFDYSLHARHSKAFNDKCETCHHVYDEAAKVLKYEKGQEEACHSCHGAVDEERTLSLANASHRSCVSCHLARVGKELESGPVLCVGCHDLAHQHAIERLQEIPRLVRGQPDTLWIHGDGARSAAVPFGHLAHEPVTRSCSTCHHKTLKPCDECHSLTGSPEGSGVTAAEAYHLSSSEHSCVGCHALQTVDKKCAGCHHPMTESPAKRTCVVCHHGPVPGSLALEIAPTLADWRLDALPAPSDAFPETVTIDFLVDRYEASKLPHAKIVAKLDETVRESTLASRFHKDTETLCSGCHHHTPAGTRPPPCRACHSAAEPTRDQPGLKVAYHRQCVGCHIAMVLPKQGCTDCHAERAEEVVS